MRFSDERDGFVTLAAPSVSGRNGAETEEHEAEDAGGPSHGK